MKKLFLTTLVLAVAWSAANAETLKTGTQSIRFSGQVDFDTAQGEEVEFDVGWGYFFRDNIEFGPFLSFLANDAVDVWELGVLSNVYAALNSQLMPYAGAGFGFAGSDADYGAVDEDQTAGVVNINAGALFFLRPQFAFDAKFNVRIATDEIYPGEDEVEDSDARFLFGLRYFFAPGSPSRPAGRAR